MSTKPWSHVAEVSDPENTSDRNTSYPDVTDSAISEAFSKYVSNGMNFGSDSFETRVAEQDAFTAGWRAAIACIAGIKED